MAEDNPYRVKARAISQAIYNQFAPEVELRFEISSISYIQVTPNAEPTVIIINFREYSGTHFTVNLMPKSIKDCFANVRVQAPVEVHGTIMDDLVDVAKRHSRGVSIVTPEDNAMWAMLGLEPMD